MGIIRNPDNDRLQRSVFRQAHFHCHHTMNAFAQQKQLTRCQPPGNRRHNGCWRKHRKHKQVAALVELAFELGDTHRDLQLRTLTFLEQTVDGLPGRHVLRPQTRLQHGLIAPTKVQTSAQPGKRPEAERQRLAVGIQQLRTTQ
ncbi:hypothetical protein D3C79_726100 [compost metagenome]